MKRLFFIFLLSSPYLPISTHSYMSLYLGWENFSSTILPQNTKANSIVYGVIGNTPTRVYFYYNVLAKNIFTTGESSGCLGWGLDLAGGIGYRFLNAAYKRSGWDIGLDLFGYFAPYFLNSQTGYTETALYYGLGLGLSSIYKINPYIGVGIRAGIKYNIGTKYLASKQPSTSGIKYFIGTLMTF